MKTLFYFIFILLVSSCEFNDLISGKDCINRFILPLNVDTTGIYYVGDTLTISSIFPRKLEGYQELELPPMGTYDISNIKWDPYFSVRKVDTDKSDYPLRIMNDENIELIQNEEFNYIIGVDENNNKDISSNYKLGQDSFYLVHKLLVKKKGTYFIEFFSFGGNSTNYQTFPGQCKGKFSFETFYRFQNKMTYINAEFIKDAPSLYMQNVYKGTLGPPPHVKSFYCFKVI